MDIPNAAAPGSGPTMRSTSSPRAISMSTGMRRRCVGPTCSPTLSHSGCFRSASTLRTAMAARAARRGPSSTESIPKPAADAGGADFLDLEGLALRRAIELGDGHWEERVRTAHDALAATPLPPRGEPGLSFAKTPSGEQVVDLSALIRRRS